jgi:hypothetical protein
MAKTDTKQWNEALLVACSTFLSEWDDSLDASGVVENLHNGDLVTIWQPFEDWVPEELALVIEALADNIYSLLYKYTERKEQ